MRDVALLGARLLLGGYMGIHASQKLLGAAATEIAGGILTITGIADPAGPLAVAGAMSVAADA